MIVNAMSVDVEDYFQVSAFEGIVPRDQWDRQESRVQANVERLLRIFDEAGVRATFFVLGWVGERLPGMVRRIASLGHEVASHGYAHRLVYDGTPDAFREDIKRAKDILESTVGVPVLGYRAPSYSITRRSLWAIDVLIEEGFAYDASIFPIVHDRYGIPGSPRRPFLIQRACGSIVEAPPSTIRMAGLTLPISGGGYFRIAPYAFTRWGLARLNRRDQQPAFFYVHPWEIDPEQPRLPANAIGRFRHYRNLDKTESRLRTLLREFAFGRVCDVLTLDQRPAPQPPHALGVFAQS
jgi:polysaccharide deacetylase family protein (PEP-CTERM system associated)